MAVVSVAFLVRDAARDVDAVRDVARDVVRDVARDVVRFLGASSFSESAPVSSERLLIAAASSSLSDAGSSLTCIQMKFGQLHNNHRIQTNKFIH